jgi:flavin-dependent dehydrogenase
MSELPVVVIGAGPQGLAAAAHLVERDENVTVLERGPGPAAAVSEWGHVRLFSAWPELIDAAARRLLEPTGWTAPSSGYPTGAEWVSGYLAPLAKALGERVRYATNVTGVARQGRDKVVDGGRKSQPFVVHTVDADGNEARLFRILRGRMASPRSVSPPPRARSRTAFRLTCRNSRARMSSWSVRGTPPHMPYCA